MGVCDQDTHKRGIPPSGGSEPVSPVMFSLCLLQAFGFAAHLSKPHLINTFLYVQYRDDGRTRGHCTVLSGQAGRPLRPRGRGAPLRSPGPDWCR